MAENSYGLLVIDVDGTLVGRDGSISQEDREALARVRQSGVQVSLSTGRVTSACRNIINQLSLNGYHIFFDGALVCNHDQSHEIYVQPLDSGLVKEAVEVAHEKNIYLELYSATRYFVERETWATEIRRRFFDIEPTLADFNDLWQQERIIKLELTTSSPEEEAQANDFQLNFDQRLRFSWARTPAYPGFSFINITEPRISKGKALEILSSHLGISLNEVIAIGDGANDIPLLSAAGMAIAMNNAPAEVKAVADHVTLDVDRHGLAAAIEKFLL